MQLVKDVNLKKESEVKIKKKKFTLENIKKQWVLIAMSFPFVV